MAYKHTNNTTGGTMAGGHQVVICSNGVPGVALGMAGNVWTSGTFIGNGSGITGLNASNLTTGTVNIARISSTSSRTSSSETALLHAKAMNDHRTSGDHDGRYIVGGSDSAEYLNDLRSVGGGTDPQISTALNHTGYRIKGAAQFFAGAPHVMVALNYTGSGNAGVLDVNYRGVYKGGIIATPTSVNYHTASDYRLKESPTPVKAGLRRLGDIRVYEYLWKRVKGSTKSMGVFAHELQEILPEAVSGTKDEMETVGVIKRDGDVLEANVPQSRLTPALAKAGATWEATGESPKYQAVDYSKIVPLLVAAVQELTDEVNVLKSQLSEVA